MTKTIAKKVSFVSKLLDIIRKAGLPKEDCIY